MFAPSGGLTGRMLGLKQAMELRVTGDGSWQNWTGKANARVDDLDLLDLTLVMSKGQFDLSGAAAPTSLLSGKLQRLTRSEERRVGNEWVRTCRSRGSTYHH